MLKILEPQKRVLLLVILIAMLALLVMACQPVAKQNTSRYEGKTDARSVQSLATLRRIEAGDKAWQIKEFVGAGALFILIVLNLWDARRTAADRAQKLRTEAEGLMRAHQPKTALTKLQDAIALAPKDPDLLIATGHLYCFQRNFSEAQKLFERALSIRRDDANALYGRGLCQLNLGQKDEGYRTLRKAEEKGCELGDFRLTLGDAARERGEADLAEKQYRLYLNKTTDPESRRRVEELLKKVSGDTIRPSAPADSDTIRRSE